MSKELKIGIFVVVVIVVSFFVLNYLRGEDIFNREYELVSRYENVEGLVESAPVYVKGFKAGKVTSVSYDRSTGSFSVTCSLSKDFEIPSDSKMVIYAVDIMGGKGVKIELGESDVPAADGDTLEPVYEPGLMDSIAGNIEPLLNTVSSALDSLSVTVSSVNSLLSAANRGRLENMIANLDRMMEDLASISASVNGKSAQISSLLDNMDSFSSKLVGIGEKVDTTMSGVCQVMETVNQADIEGLIASFKSLVENINDPDGSVGKLLKDDSVYNSVDSLLSDINLLVEKIQENPKKYLKISVF